MTSTLRPVALRWPEAERAATLRLRGLERSAPFRPMVRPSTFRVLRTLLITACGLLGSLVLGVAAAWAGGQLQPSLVVLMVAGLDVVAFGVLLRRAASRPSLNRVTDPPDAGLLRALDMHAPTRFLVLVARPAALAHGVILALDGIVLVGSGAIATAPWALVVLVLPVTSAVIIIALAARRCSRRRTPARGPVAQLVIAGTAFAVGLVIGRVADLLVGTGPDRAPEPSTIRAGILVLTGVMVLVAGTLAGVGGHHFGRLVDLDRHDPKPAASRRGPHQREYERMGAMVTRSPLASSVVGWWRAVLQLAALGAGAVVGGVHLPAAVRGTIGPLLAGYAFVSVLVASGIVFSIAGPSAMADRLRFQWENSELSAGRLAARALEYPLSVVVGPASLLAAAQSALTGRVTLRILALGLSLVGAAVLAESALPVTAHADGTITHHPLAAWVVLLASLPAAVIPAGVVGAVLSTLYGLSILGAGHRCLSRRILRLPSTSPI